MPERLIVHRRVLRLRDGVAKEERDQLAAEEPMEIRVNGEAVSVTMRTPGHDFELALGFCLTEGILDDHREVLSITYCTGTGPDQYNVVNLQTRSGRPVSAALRRNVYTSSSCGLCGTASIEAVRKRTPDVSDDPLAVTASSLARLPEQIRAAQRIFAATGGLHAAAIFTAEGEMRCLREDVGRHNAVDKAIGWAAGQGALPLPGHILMLSGRIAFEIVQKALTAGLPMIAAVSAPSALAVSLAEAAGATLVGFLRGPEMNIYTSAHRVLLDGPLLHGS